MLRFLRFHPHFDFLFFFNDTATTEIYPLSLHDALPISPEQRALDARRRQQARRRHRRPVQRILDHHRLEERLGRDRKSTRLNSSHGYISYAVFCLKKKKVTSPRRVTSTPSKPMDAAMRN